MHCGIKEEGKKNWCKYFFYTGANFVYILCEILLLGKLSNKVLYTFHDKTYTKTFQLKQ